jgi:hypothetical protein
MTTIPNNNLKLEPARALLGSDQAQAVSFGRLFIGNAPPARQDQETLTRVRGAAMPIIRPGSQVAGSHRPRTHLPLEFSNKTRSA